MRLGVHLKQWGPEATRAATLDIAQAAEECGFDSLWVADHLTYPRTDGSKYPYHPDGTFPTEPEDGFLEAFTLLSVVAGATSRIGIGTSVLVLPIRHPLLVAKVASTLDVLSGGRLQLAVGAGWWKEEFDALAQRFDARGRRMDEQIEILRKAWTLDSFSHHGEFYDIEEVTCRPHPLQHGGPPVLIGGLGTLALNRALRLGDAWHVVGADAQVLAEQRRQLDAGARDVFLSTSTGMPRDPDRARQRFASFVEAGVSQAVVTTNEDAAGLIRLMELYRDEVIPGIGA